ncbi:MAG: YbaK/EbsC family protein [Candidatus Eisenbacteria bacterium]|nr:YbaK/EbsC family protein [Candidatus Eisenbacteria bacterium]
MNAPAPGGALSEAARRVQDALVAGGFGNRVIELREPVRTAQAAADAVGCEVGQIVKSLVFRRTGHAGEGGGVLVLASGASRVDVAKLATLLGGGVEMGDPRFVRAVTGFAIGGIPPLGHAQALEVVMDERLLAHEALWAAAGHPNSLFPLTPDELRRMAGGRVADVT